MAMMKAPVDMVCPVCGSGIVKGTFIERVPSAPGARYKHVGCSRGNPPGKAPAPRPGAPAPTRSSGPKGWVTEDKFALPEDAIKRLRGQDAPHDRDETHASSTEVDDRVDDPEEDTGRAEKGGKGAGELDGTADSDGADGEASNRGGETGPGELGDGESDDGEEDTGPGGPQPDGDGSGLDEDEDDDGDESGEDWDGSEPGNKDGEEDGDEPGDEKESDTGKEKPGDKQPGDKQKDDKGENGKEPDKQPKGKGDDQKPKAEPKRNGKLEDLPDDLLLKLAMLAAQMAEERLRGKIEPRLAKILAEIADPLTAKMASEFQTKMGDSVKQRLDRAVTDTRQQADKLVSELRKEVDKRCQDEIRRLDGLKQVVHKIERPDGTGKEFPETEMFHSAFDEVLKLSGAGFDTFTPGPTGCIAGDMWLRYVVRKDGKLVNKKGGRFDNLFRRFHGLEPKPGKPKASDGCEYFIQSVNDDGYVFLNRINDVIDSGTKEVFWVTTESGNQVKATADHPFMSEVGYVPLRDLRPGHVIYSVPRSAQATGRAKRPYRKEVFVKYHRRAVQKVVNGSVYHRLRVYHAVIEADRNSMTYDDYVTCLNTADRETIDNLWSIPDGCDVHHIDENCHNNELSNLKLVSSAAHDAMHSTGVKIYAEEDRIVSIESAGYEQVYDLVVADPFRNFVVEDIVVHNCGKTHLYRQVADALGLPFGIVSGTGGVTETELFGNATPNLMTGENVYQPTEFVTLYENGGLFLLDEADGMDANCLLKVNSAIANGYCTIPKRLSKPRANRHKDFVFALAANTWGHGATRMYCGRNKLDEATLDRFRGGTVAMDYDPNIERRLVGDQELYRTLSGWRQKITTAGLQRVLSTRFMVQAVKLRALGYDVKGIARKLTGGWTPGEIEKVVGKL